MKMTTPFSTSTFTLTLLLTLSLALSGCDGALRNGSSAALAGCDGASRNGSSASVVPERPLDAATATWRVEPQNVAVSFAGETGGRTNVLSFAYPAKEGLSGGKVLLANYDLRRIFASWVPPYVGVRARAVTCAVRLADGAAAPSPGVSCRLRCRSNQSWIASKWHVFETDDLAPRLAAGAWADVRLDLGLDRAGRDRLADVAFAFDGKGRVALEVADVRVVLDDGSTYPLVNGEAPSYRTGMKKPFATKPPRAFPRRDRIQFGTGGQWVIEYPDSVKDFAAYMAKYLPEYDIVFSMGGAFDPRFVAALTNAPANLFFQWQGGQHDLRYAGLKDALVKTAKGKPQSRCFNSAVATHPLFQFGYEDEIAYLGTMGFNNVQRYDYVWYYPDGLSGFDDASVAAYREDLLGKDEGLDLVADGIRPARRIHFWDYYADYHGTPPSPADYGFSSWAEYVPKITPKTEKLFFTLICYEWLRLAQRFGEWSEKYCYGSPYDQLLNGETRANANDHVYLTRLRTSGICSPEFFSGTLKVLSGCYRGAGRFLRNAKACGKKFGITVETSRGGSGSTPYWSPRTGYAVCYFLAALGFDGFEYDGLPGKTPWADYASGRNPFDKAELDLGMADARGYRQARRDGARRPDAAGVYHVISRPVAGNPGHFYWDAIRPSPHDKIASLNRDFRYDLRREELLCDTTDPQELPEILPKAKLVFASPEAVRGEVMGALAAWAKERPGRTLVTNRAEVATAAAAQRVARVQRPAAEGLAPVEVLPFAARVGSVAVLFSRAGCAAGDRDDWYERVWRPVVYKRTLKGELCYPDKVPGADAAAEVPVAEGGDWRVYRFLADEETVAQPKDGFLRLPLGDDLADVVYYGRDTAAFRAFLGEVKAERVLTAEFIEEK